MIKHHGESTVSFGLIFARLFVGMTALFMLVEGSIAAVHALTNLFSRHQKI